MENAADALKLAAWVLIFVLALSIAMNAFSTTRAASNAILSYKDREYESIFTGLKYTMYDPYYTCVFGKTRIDFTDRMKIYNDKRYRRKT